MEKFKYDNRLLGMAEKYGFVLLQNSDTQDNIHQKVHSILEEKCYRKRVAMWGVGDINNEANSYVAKFLDKYATLLQQTVCLADSREELWGKRFVNIPIVSPEEIKSYDADVILITSFRSSKFIAEDIKKLLPGLEYIDIYEELKKKGINTEKDIFTSRSLYSEIYYQRIKYEDAKEPEEKSIELRSLISRYVELRDLPYILKYLDEYIESRLPDFKNAADFKYGLEKLIQELRQKLKGKSSDIALIFLDAFRGADWFDQEKKEFKVLKGLSEKSACFVNMNATAPVTYESFYSIATGKLPLEENVYGRSCSFLLKEFKFLDAARKKGIKTKLYFSDTYPIIDPKEEVEYIKSVYLTEKLWFLLCEMASDSKKTIHFIQSTKELHVPFLCGYFSTEPNEIIFSKMGIEEEEGWDIKEQFKNCLDYVNLEVGYYLDFLSEDMIKAVFSDHAHVVYDDEKSQPFYLYYNDLQRSVHNVFMVTGKNVKPRVINKLTSMQDFGYILKPLLENGDAAVPDREIIQYQYYPILNKSIRECASLYHGENYIDGIKCFRNEDYMAVFTAGGTQEAYEIHGDMVKRSDSVEAVRFLNKIKEAYDVSIPVFDKT